MRVEKLLPAAQGNTLYALQRAVAALGFCEPPASRTGGHSRMADGGPAVWQQWVDRWHLTSTLTPRVRGGIRSNLLKAGRWAEAEYPEAADPAAWSRRTCAAWVAAVDRMNVGDYVQRTIGLELGKPLQAATKPQMISAMRRFFLDTQEWEWLPRRFDPYRVLATPRSVGRLLGPNPRVIADEVWAKLLWAGLNLVEDDLPHSQAGFFYPSNWSARSRSPGCSPGSVRTRSRGCDSGASAGSTTDTRSPATPISRPPTRSACWTCRRTRPAPPSASRSTRSSARPSTPGRPTAPTSPGCSTGAPERWSIRSSPSAPTAYRWPTSTTPSSPCSAARPESLPPTCAATSPATAPARPSPASSTTPRSR